MLQYNILCATDDNYVPYCGIMLTSLFENNKELNFCIYILVEQLSNKSKNEFATLARIYNQRIEIITVDSDKLKDCPIRKGDHVSIATYYRLLAPRLLPSNIEKILYLDCDMIIDSDITDLYNVDIDGYPIAMSIDEAFFDDKKYLRLEYSKKDSYRNAGVALLNIRYWKEQNLMEKCFEYISNNSKKLIFHDQDTLNALLHHKIKSLPIKYNLQTGFLLTNYAKYYKNKMPEILEATKSAVIIHFTGESKPWFKDSRHPYRKRFMHYKNISLWKAYPLKKNRYSLYERIIRLRNEVIWAWGIKKRPRSYIIEEQA